MTKKALRKVNTSRRVARLAAIVLGGIALVVPCYFAIRHNNGGSSLTAVQSQYRSGLHLYLRRTELPQGPETALTEDRERGSLIQDPTNKCGALQLPVDAASVDSGGEPVCRAMLPWEVPFSGRREKVWVAFANSAYLELLLNWVAHCRKIKLPHFVVAFEPAIGEACRQHNIPYILHDQPLEAGIFRANITKFRKMGSQKGRIVRHVMEQYGYDTVILSDVDTVWLRDPSDVMADHPTADIFISTDCLSHVAEASVDPYNPLPATTHGFFRCGHTPGSKYGRSFNTGVIIFRNRPATLVLLDAWHTVLTDPNLLVDNRNKFTMTDQQAFNYLLEKGITVTTGTPDDTRVIWAHDNTVRLMPLPVLRFASGNVMFQQHLPERHGIKPHLVHATFTPYGIPGKRARFREVGMWLNDPISAFQGTAYMTYENTVEAFIDSTLPKTTPLLKKHLIAGAYQLAALLDAAAIAVNLNRTLVLPRFMCWCDQDWYASILQNCTISGSDQQVPFACPADTFSLRLLSLPVEAMVEHGAWTYRMAGFLDDERLPRSTKDSVHVVRTLAEPFRRFITEMSSNEPPDNVQPLGTTLPELQAGNPAAPAFTAKVLVINMVFPGCFMWAGDPQTIRDFDYRINRMLGGSSWCCSGEQPVKDPAWVNWPIPGPAGLLQRGANFRWHVPAMPRPTFCDELDEKNAAFLVHQNHPCNFLERPISRMPEFGR